MGFKAAAIGRGRAIAEEALKLGAHVYVDASQEDAASELKSMGGASAIVATIGEAQAVSSLITGTPYDNEKTFDFSVLAGVRPRIETMPLAQAFAACQKMRSGEVAFRMVLTMEERRHAH